MLRVLGYLFSALALWAFATDVWNGPMQEAELVFTSTAEFWFENHRDSWLGVQPFVQKKLSPELWDSVVLPALSLPLFAPLAIIAGFFFLIGGRRRQQNRRDGLVFPRR